MILEVIYRGCWKGENGQKVCQWRIGLSDNTKCEFPSQERIVELAHSCLGKNGKGESTFLGVKRRYQNCVILQIRPGMIRKKIMPLASAIAKETTLA